MRKSGERISNASATVSWVVCAIVLASPAFGQRLRRMPDVGGADRRPVDVVQLQDRIQTLESALAQIEGAALSSPGRVELAAFFGGETETAKSGGGFGSLLGDFDAKIGGYVKADFIHDFDAIGSTDAFDPITIPTDGRQGTNSRFHARQTRLNLDVRTWPEQGKYRLFVEGDFFGAGTTFRMRHAFVETENLLAGQTWTTFMDVSILPPTLDFESPRSVILSRRGMLRWTHPVSDAVSLDVAMEDPQAALATAAAPAGVVEQAAPDLVFRIRAEQPTWHLQAASVVRVVRYRQSTGAKDDAVGWGLNFTGASEVREFHRLLFQFAFGEGVETYRQGTDGAVNAMGVVELNPVIAWVVGYEVDWSDRLSSMFVYSAAEGTLAAFQPPSTAQQAEYIAANLIFRPAPRLSWGVEYLYGLREDKGGARGEANRLQFSVRYDLP